MDAGADSDMNMDTVFVKEGHWHGKDTEYIYILLLT